MVSFSIPAINAGLPLGVSVAPYAYSSSDHNGITGAYMAIIKNGVLVAQGGTAVTDDSPTGKVTPFSGQQSAPPANGITSS